MTTTLPTNTTRTSPADPLRCPTHDEMIFLEVVDIATTPWGDESAALLGCPAKGCRHHQVVGFDGLDLEAIT